MLDRRLKAWSGFGMPVEGERRRADGERALVRHGEKGRCRASRAMPSQAGQAVRESVVAIRHFWQDARSACKLSTPPPQPPELDRAATKGGRRTRARERQAAPLQDEAEESDATEEEATRERTTRVDRPARWHEGCSENRRETAKRDRKRRTPKGELRLAHHTPLLEIPVWWRRAVLPSALLGCICSFFPFPC